MKKSLISSLILFLLVTNCDQNQFVNELDAEKLKIVNQIKTDVFDEIGEKKYLLLLIMRDCSCVEENINFVNNNINLLKNNTIIYVKNPSNNILWGDLEPSLKESNIMYFVDSMNISEKHGLLLATDKLFLINNESITSGAGFEVGKNAHYLIN